MNKTQKDYAANRVQETVRTRIIECECEKPSLADHIKKAVIEGTAKPIPPKQISELFRQKIIEGGRYDAWKADGNEIFQEPQSYKDAMAVVDAEKAKHKAANDAALKEAQKIVDAIYLDKYEDGEAAIAEAHKIIPKL